MAECDITRVLRTMVGHTALVGVAGPFLCTEDLIGPVREKGDGEACITAGMVAGNDC